jgi:benzoyl-CoA 2,3-epoxidase subunit B
LHISPQGHMLSDAVWAFHADEWLPTEQDHAFVASLMRPVTAPGKMASWIAPPTRGIHGKPIDFAYVKFN